ncbi:flagellar filament capping protein FliD [Massilia sp. IC2-477]|uniref:flagellar filament capping protein FliD n=1 Tax=unclassified Massilia TaxID=2609279 RepID=UPI001D10127B|nr:MULTISPECIES: flagellar filament capping protein FliD [unclassified Massilia]MCC2954322.1 flagellar filament capping protein FliD [Massilia sp. IC2-477]MCC2971761.1 flagellar filament capping protein FliD [Massilia sp. IC2-476]
MATAITAPTYDPVNTANMLADKYVLARQQILDAQLKEANATEKGLTELNSAMTAFQTSLASLTGFNKSMYAQAATYGDTSFGSATASATAAAGSYSFFVKQLATASQVSYTGLTETNSNGTLGIKMGGALAFNVNLNAADTDANGKLSPRELAAAINSATGNTSLVTASIVTTGTTSELVLTAKNTGANTAITIDTSAVGGPASIKQANNDPARVHTLVAAKDAEIRIGSENGTPIIQATNTFTNIDGVKMTFTKAHATGAAPLTVTVGPDASATTANVQAFVDAYNKLKGILNKLTDAGDPSKGAAGGVFAHDGGIRALNDRLVSLLRPTTSGDTLASFGIIATKDGSLELRSDRLQKQLALKPTGLDTIIGSATSSPATGIAGALDKFVKGWSNSADGQIKKRKEATAKEQDRVADRQAFLDKQHEAAYNRYLKQFTALASLQGAMTNNLSMFDALFGNNKD